MVIQPKIADSKTFKIGHSSTQSETFWPEYKTDVQNQKLIFVDIASLSDSGGLMVDFINSFINKMILKRAPNVKILMPLTITQITASRGDGVREFIQTLQNMCNTHDPKVANSIQLVITQCKLDEADKEVNDIDLIRHTIH